MASEEATTEVAVFDKDALTDRISAVVQEQFAKLIPKEHWDNLVKTEIERFFRDGETQYGREQPSKFRVMVSEMITELVGKQIKETLSGENLYMYGPDSPVENASDLIKEVAKAMAPAALEGLMQRIAAQVMAGIQLNV